MEWAIANQQPIVVRGGWSHALKGHMSEQVAKAARSSEHVFFTDRGNKVSMMDALYPGKNNSAATGTYKKIMAGNVPAESHYLNLLPLFAAAFDRHMYSLPSQTMTLLIKTFYYYYYYYHMRWENTWHACLLLIS